MIIRHIERMCRRYSSDIIGMKISTFILKTVLFLELVKGLGASRSHLGLDLLFENRLRRPNGRLRRNYS